MKNYYDILGLRADCTDSDIKKAFRKLAIKYHPDKNKSVDASDKFREINEAYETLGVPERRKEYDAKMNRTYIGDDFIKNFTYDFSPDFGMSDIFDAMYSFSDRGTDIIREIPISFKEAYLGTNRKIMLDDLMYNISILPGTVDGTILKDRGKGKKGKTRNGDLVIKVKVLSDERYKIDNGDIHLEYNIDIFTAITGGSIDIELPDSLIKIKVPQYTQPGKIFRLSGKGMRKKMSSDLRGDVYVHLNMLVPTLLEDDFLAIEKMKERYAKRTEHSS